VRRAVTRKTNDEVQKGIVFNIQRYSIHDGPGIRTTVFLKGCVLRCYWCQNPESQAMKPEILLNKNTCTLCGRCVDVCVIGASSRGAKSSVIDRDTCIGCGACVEVCPVHARVLVGREMTVHDVMAEVLRDKAFYDNSQGGVTLSGGDPIAQPEFALQLLRACKDRGLHTAIETCGLTAWPVLERLLDYTDLVLFDFKCLDPVRHRKATGKGNRRIIDNARKVSRSKTMRVRVPLIPGFNDSPQDVKAVLRFAQEELGLRGSDIDLLRYNQLGEVKFERLEREGVRPSMEPQTEEYINALEAIIKAG
jgi:pyruvate formate lyase activating enzyme